MGKQHIACKTQTFKKLHAPYTWCKASAKLARAQTPTKPASNIAMVSANHHGQLRQFSPKLYCL
eukprot:3233897-Amphidinium_carterae.1